jgi:hypothetical protein
VRPRIRSVEQPWALTWDVNGNLLSDGVRSYAWDAETLVSRRLAS